MEIIEGVRDLKNLIPENNSQPYPISITPNRNDNIQNNAIGTNEAVHLDKEETSSVSKKN
jgi:hypothetical protein